MRGQVAGGDAGYRHQLERVRRFLERIESPGRDEVEFKDMFVSFFMHCWHLKDWIWHDQYVPVLKRIAIKAQAHARGSPLGLCRDIANGAKHVKLDDPSSGSGARPDHIAFIMYASSSRASEVDYIIDDGHGGRVSGKELARKCVAEWERLLEGAGLPV